MSTSLIPIQPSPQLNNNTNPPNLSILLDDPEDYPTYHQAPSTPTVHHLRGYNAERSVDQTLEQRHRSPVRHLSNMGSQARSHESRSVRSSNSSTSRRSQRSGLSHATKGVRQHDSKTYESKYDDN